MILLLILPIKYLNFLNNNLINHKIFHMNNYPKMIKRQKYTKIIRHNSLMTILNNSNKINNLISKKKIF